MSAALALAAVVLLAPATSLRVAVDSVRREVVLLAGPFRIPPMAEDPEGMEGMEHDGMHHGVSEMFRFDWPVDGALRGFDVALVDSSGIPLPAGLLHHMIGVNFDRRQLVYPALERPFGWGGETDRVALPAGVGVPMPRGEHLGFYVAWHNESGRPVDGAYLRIVIAYTNGARVAAPVLPFYVDVRNVIGGVTTFDLPPGRSSTAYEFTVPIDGRLLAVGGHLHRYGTRLRLEDAASGRVLVELKAARAKDGDVRSVPRFIFGFREDALPLRAGRRYRVVADYDNTSGAVVRAGGMGHINGAFQPDDLAAWPRLDLGDPELRRDIAALPRAAGGLIADEPR